MSASIPQSADVMIEQNAFIFGQQDAEQGERCVPEMCFYRRADQIEYCRGYASVAGHNLTTRQFLGDEANVEVSAERRRTTIVSFEDAYKVACHIDEKLNDGECAIIAGERIEKRGCFMYILTRNGGHWTPSELAHLIIWPNRKAWNQAIRQQQAA